MQQSNLAPDALGTKVTRLALDECVPVQKGMVLATLESTPDGTYSTSGAMRCPIHLLTGATITSVRVRYHDNDPASNLGMTLGVWAFDSSLFAEFLLASYGTTGSSPSAATATLNWYSNPPKVTGDEAFHLGIEATSNLKTILGFQISYTL